MPEFCQESKEFMVHKHNTGTCTFELFSDLCFEWVYSNGYSVNKHLQFNDTFAIP